MSMYIAASHHSVMVAIYIIIIAYMCHNSTVTSESFLQLRISPVDNCVSWTVCPSHHNLSLLLPCTCNYIYAGTQS